MNKWVRRFLYFIAGLLSLILLLFLFLQTRWAKNIIRNKVESYVSTRTNTEFRIGSIDYSLPKWVELNGIFMRDRNNDTLMYGNLIRANVDMLALISGKYRINKVTMDNIFVNLKKSATDSVFNYQFIIDAFASGSETATQADTSAIDLSLNELDFKNVRFNMLDDFTGSYYRFSVKEFLLKLKNLDVNTLNFDVDKLYADQLRLLMRITKQDTAMMARQDSAVLALPVVQADSLLMKNSYVAYIDEVNEIRSINDLGQIAITGLSNVQRHTLFRVNKLQLANSNVEFSHVIKPEKQTVVKENVGNGDSVEVTNNMSFIVDAIDLRNNRIKYDDNGAPVQVNGMDYAHLDINKLQLQAKNTQFVDGNIQSTIEEFSFTDKSGFQLDTLRGFVNIDSNNINLKDVVIKTPNSQIYAQALIYPTSFTDPVRGRTDLPENNIVLNNTIISQKDLELLATSAANTYKKQLQALGNLRINAHVEGNAREMYVRELDLRSTNGTAFSLQMSGRAANLNDTRNLAYNFDVANLTASRALIDPFVNDKEKVVSLPPVLDINGNISGNMNTLNTNLNLASAYGRANAKGVLANFQDPQNMRYDLVLTANNLETGKWIYQDSLMGKLTGTVSAKGSNGFDYKTMNLSSAANISSFRLQKNVINNIKLNTVLANGIADIVGSINDELLQMNINGKANIKTDYPTLNAFLNLRKADLYALGYATDSMEVAFLGNIDINNSTPRNLDAIIRLDSAMLLTGGKRIYIDSAEVTGFRRNDSTLFTIASPIADADIASNLTYVEMPNLIMEVLGYYFDNFKAESPSPQGTIVLSGQLKPGDTYKALVNDFNFNNIFFNAAITNADRDSALKANIVGERFQFGDTRLSSLVANINGTSDSLLMAVDADTIQSGNFKLYEATVNAGFSDNNISAGLASKDANSRQQFGIGVTAAQNTGTNGYDIHLSDTLMLNYDKWSVNPGNIIKYSPEGFNIQDFAISNRGQRIAINSNGTAFTSPLVLNIDDFKLTTITSALDTDSMEVDGLLNADITISDLQNAIPTMDGQLSVDSILYQRHKIGNLNLNANSSNNNVSVSGKLEGYGNNVDINGNYNASNIDVKVNLNPLTSATIEAFSNNMLKRSEGTLTGPINITGSVEKPVWNGQLTFNDFKTTVAEYGTYVRMDNQTINLQYPNVQFNNLTVYDSLGNALKVDGTVRQTETDFVSNLSINTTNFRAMQSTAKDNKMVYGTAIVDLNTKLTGPLTAPNFTGAVTVKNGTDVTYVQATTPASVREREGLIEFVDMDTVRNLVTQRTLREIEEEQARASAPAVLNYNFNLEVEPEAQFSVVIDPATGDELKVQGKGNINVGVLPNGSPSLVGTYELNDGSYELNYGPITRRFELQKGSLITLTGDPLNAIANITAAYEISTQPLDLISNEIGGSTSPESNLYKRKVPFEVLLTINGTASKPELGFNIQIQEEAEGVSTQMSNTIENKLTQLRNDPSEMNKQVFALLAFGRFIGDESKNFFGNSGGGGGSLLANESVSGFLNAAVDQIAADLIKGVDIDIDLKTTDSDPATQRTDLNVAFGKTFLNDRLTVSFGKNFTVDGGDAASTGAKNNNVQFLPDVNTTYKISKDGRYLLRAYRKNAYEAILDGYFIETGVAFTLSMDYNKFKEIFSRSNK